MMVRPFSLRRTATVLALASGFALLAVPTFAQATTQAPTQTSQPTETQVGNTTMTGQTTTGVDKDGHTTASSTVTFSKKKKKDEPKAERVQQAKATKKDEKTQQKLVPIAAKDQTLPDKQLYDKALDQVKRGHFDVARLDLQTLLNTYPDSQYQMRAKLAIADSWYHEGGAAALAQAEQEYNDFITFFPNAPEASEAQMRIGDIYFKQMDVPDRDYANAVKAEAAYRTMLRTYPDAPPEILNKAKQQLREVQEVRATREAGVAAYYQSRENWAASIARYQTVADTYPLYSHMDDVLIALGDEYSAEAKHVRETPVCGKGVVVACLPEGAKSKLLQDFDSKAASYYRDVVLKHAAAPHADDAKERLVAMGMPVPVPTPADVQASEALEGSRAQYTMQRRLELLVMHKPDTVTAAQSGEPPLDDPAATTAPTIVNDLQTEFASALNPAAVAGVPAAPATAPAAGDATPAPVSPAPAANAPLALNDVATGSGSSVTSTEMTPATPADTMGSGVGAAIISTGGASTPVSDKPAATGAADPNYGLTTVKPADTSALPAAEKPAEAPDQVNEAAGKNLPDADKSKAPKNKKAGDYDKSDESSSTHKPKKGLDKLNPF